MARLPFAKNSAIIAGTGALVSITGLAGCAIFSITPSGTIGLHPVFTAIAVIGIAIVISSSFVEAGASKKSQNPEDSY